MDKNNNQIYTVKQICEMYPQFKEQQILDAIRRKHLKAERIGTRYIVTEKNLNSWLGLDNDTTISDFEQRKLELEELKVKNEAAKLAMLQEMIKILKTQDNQSA